MEIGKLFAQIRAQGLTGRQAEVVMQVMEGKTNAVIAESLHIKEKTVKFHLTNIFKHTGNTDRYALAVWGQGLNSRLNIVSKIEL